MSKNERVWWQRLSEPVYLAPRRLLVLLVRLYQRTLSFDHGPLKFIYPHGYCPFYPSCSEYGRQSLLKYGVVRGGAKAAWRICRCHPWTEGGVDKP